jgi:dTDP-4-amino-4,6-dideoxy-D-galactose acyltransferase
VIEPLSWDSEFFGRKIGALTGSWTPLSVASDLSSARKQGYDYLISRPPVEDAAAIRALEAAGFYLTDLGVTWASEVRAYLDAAGRAGAAEARHAREDDIPWLQRTASNLFPLSRFYHDPFYTRADADRLHEAWLANSVRGKAADAVLLIPGSGFVTCKIARDGAGEVVLIGVVDGARQRGAGRALMTAAVEWFRSKGVANLRVKTQVKNLQAMNFYRRLGFGLHSTDLTMGCRLSSEEER